MVAVSVYGEVECSAVEVFELIRGEVVGRIGRAGPLRCQSTGLKIATEGWRPEAPGLANRIFHKLSTHLCVLEVPVPPNPLFYWTDVELQVWTYWFSNLSFRNIGPGGDRW